MAPATIRSLLHILNSANCAEDVFGPLSGSPDEQLQGARRIYRQMALVAHPDRHHQPKERARATDAFQLLGRWWELAEQSITAGLYGLRSAAPNRPLRSPITIRSPKHTYTMHTAMTVGDVCDVFVARRHKDDLPVVLKIARDPANNDLVHNEFKALSRLWSAPKDDLKIFGPYLPKIFETFKLQDNRQINVLDLKEGFYTLDEVCQAYPHGVEAETMSWIFNRTLEILAWAHQRGVIHGAVLPPHVMIHPVTHGAVLLDWSYAVIDSGPIRAISPDHRAHYPPEVFSKTPATAAADIFMVAGCMARLMGADPGQPIPDTVPRRMAGVLRACQIPNPQSRHNDALELYESLQEAQRIAFGPPRYHPFKMPPRSHAAR